MPINKLDPLIFMRLITILRRIQLRTAFFRPSPLFIGFAILAVLLPSFANGQIISPTTVVITAGEPITPVEFSVTGGDGSTTWGNSTKTPPPSGLTFSSSGILSGTPASPGNRTFSIWSKRPTASANVTLRILPNSPTIISPSTSFLGPASLRVPKAECHLIVGTLKFRKSLLLPLLAR